MLVPVGSRDAAGLEQLMPLTPTIDQLPAPVGVTPPVAPETVAVKIKLDPRVVVATLVVTKTLGANWEMASVAGGDGPLAV